MGRAIDMFVTYRFVKLLTQPFDKTDAFKMGIIDEKGNRTDKKLYKASRAECIHCTAQTRLQHQENISESARPYDPE